MTRPIHPLIPAKAGTQGRHDDCQIPAPKIEVENLGPRLRGGERREGRASTFSRRSVLMSGLALAACQGPEAARADSGAAPSLKDAAPFPIGAAVPSAFLDDPTWVDLALRQLDQLTPEWELKPEYVLQDETGYRFEAPDRIADFAREHGLRLHGHVLVWYSQTAPRFERLHGPAFLAEYDRYIQTVAGRYAGRMAGWDVVNEPVAEDGDGLRDCLWSERLGGQEAYIVRAFEQARAADPDAVLFLNEYNLENLPKKGATFLRLVERLLELGVPITGIGTQAHLDLEIAPSQISAFMRDAASLGLPIHVSELDASMRREGRMPDLRSDKQKRAQQVALVGAYAEAFMALPERQRYAFTTWGLRDTDSWLRREAQDDGKDSMLLFDAAGRPNPMFRPVIEAFGRAGG